MFYLLLRSGVKYNLDYAEISKYCHLNYQNVALLNFLKRNSHLLTHTHTKNHLEIFGLVFSTMDVKFCSLSRSGDPRKHGFLSVSFSFRTLDQQYLNSLYIKKLFFSMLQIFCSLRNIFLLSTAFISKNSIIHQNIKFLFSTVFTKVKRISLIRLQFVLKNCNVISS